jgi:hypothetical protein
MTDSAAHRVSGDITAFVDRRLVVAFDGTLNATTAPDLERMAVGGLVPNLDVLEINLTARSTCDIDCVAAIRRIAGAVSQVDMLTFVVASGPAYAALAGATAPGLSLLSPDQRLAGAQTD